MASLKGKHLLVGSDSPAMINWLLDQGASVTVRSTPLRRVEEHLKKTARDGADYAKRKAKLVWAPNAKGDQVDEASLFYTHRKGLTIGITGRVGKSTAVHWATHLIGDAIAAGPSLFEVIAHKNAVIVEGQGASTLISTDQEYSIADIDTAQFRQKWGEHNLVALGAAVQAARLSRISAPTIQARIQTLPEVVYRQQVIHQNRRLRVINDGLAVSPDRAVAALHHWGGPNCILIAGGQGRGSFSALAEAIQVFLRPTNLILLDGAATTELRGALGAWGRGVRSYATIRTAWQAARKRSRLFVSSVILFSPGASGNDPEVFSKITTGSL